MLMRLKIILLSLFDSIVTCSIPMRTCVVNRTEMYMKTHWYQMRRQKN